MDGDVKAIELQGIVRNKTKLNVEDGQAEDLLNLRFVDGSWRTSGDGRKVYMMTDNANGYNYTQIYVHTNIYRHLLGVRDGKLYWFADIATDGVTFTPKATPEELTSVTGDMWITQTGHLLTVIDQDDMFKFFLFKTGIQTYVAQDVKTNSHPTDRSLFPYGYVYFNYYTPTPPHILTDSRTVSIIRGQDSRFYKDEDLKTVNHPYVAIKQYNAGADVTDLLKVAYKELTDLNKFTNPFLALLAVRLYDGSLTYASNPILIYPRQQSSNHRLYFNADGTISNFTDSPKYDSSIYPVNGMTAENDGRYVQLNFVGKDITTDTITYKTQIQYYTLSKSSPIIDAYDFTKDWLPISMMAYQNGGENCHYVIALGHDLTLSIDFEYMKDLLNEENDLFSSLCIFITPPVQGTKLYESGSDADVLTEKMAQRKASNIIDELKNEPFFLLKEYKKKDLNTFSGNSIIIDLSGEENDGLLANITAQEQLSYEAIGRTTYLPKYVYQYNGRLHIADYLAKQYNGYPLDCFHLSNHSLWKTNGYFKNTIRNLKDNLDSYQQYPRKSYSFPLSTAIPQEYFAFSIVTLNIDGKKQQVVKYIDKYTFSQSSIGYADFIEELNPLITYPDTRAEKIEIVVVQPTSNTLVEVVGIELELTPHSFYNYAYYFEPDLKPIKLLPYNNTSVIPLPTDTSIPEYFPNGLKVSKTGNPMFFPVENTYQVGSGQILAMCSNAIAVGTGQTGQAPLYVFCTDGIYALFVDSSGQMTYTNARVIARDVLNNPRSVTPIDQGVVFTTDRGLMMIAGEQVKEIGQPAEGDVLQFANSQSSDFIKIAKGALTQVAALPDTLCDKTDFLTYLTGAIVNYNHNERELMISNPAKGYSYILDRNGNWARRDYSADEYILNYPTSYRLRNGEFYKVDEEGDDSTPLEEKKQADNKFFYTCIV